MSTTQNTPQTAPAVLLAQLCAQLDLILGNFLIAIAAQFRLVGPKTVLVWNRVSRARQRLIRIFTNMAARLDSGLALRVNKPRPGRKSGPRLAPLPKSHAWLIRKMGYHAAAFGSQLDHLLAKPEYAALFAASPGAMRTLRPIARLLGMTLPEPMRLPPRPPRPKPVKPPEPEASQFQDRPIPAYVLAAARAWKRRRPKDP